MRIGKLQYLNIYLKYPYRHRFSVCMWGDREFPCFVGHLGKFVSLYFVVLVIERPNWYLFWWMFILEILDVLGLRQLHVMKICPVS